MEAGCVRKLPSIIKTCSSMVVIFGLSIDRDRCCEWPQFSCVKDYLKDPSANTAR